MAVRVATAAVTSLPTADAGRGWQYVALPAAQWRLEPVCRSAKLAVPEAQPSMAVRVATAAVTFLPTANARRGWQYVALPAAQWRLEPVCRSDKLAVPEAAAEPQACNRGRNNHESMAADGGGTDGADGAAIGGARARTSDRER